MSPASENEQASGWIPGRQGIALCIAMVAGVAVGVMQVAFIFTDFVMDEDAPWRKDNPYYYGDVGMDGDAPAARMAAMATAVVAPASVVAAALLNNGPGRGRLTAVATAFAVGLVLVLGAVAGAIGAAALFAFVAAAVGGLGYLAARPGRGVLARTGATLLLLAPVLLLLWLETQRRGYLAGVLYSIAALCAIAIVEIWTPQLRPRTSSAAPMDRPTPATALRRHG